MKNYQITSWVHHFLEDHVQPGDICIDATMGNGNDTALLSKLAGDTGRVVAFDIQQMALDNTKEKMKKECCPNNYELVLDSHETMAKYAVENTVSCITFNLGYLPGGDHGKATKGESSIRAIETGLGLLKKKGLMTVCIYSGGDSGFEEKDAVLSYIKSLDAKKISGYYFRICESAKSSADSGIDYKIIELFK